MEVFPTGCRGLSDESVKPSASVNEAEATVTVSPPQFEWIQHGDATARKRARAHVTRGFRREKAANVKSKPKKSESEETSEGDSPRKNMNSFSLNLSTNTTYGELLLDQPIDNEKPRNYSEAAFSDEGRPPILELSRTIGAGLADPFACMPIQLGPGTHALLDHFLSGVAPATYKQDSRANFGPVKTLSFEVALSAPPAFHVILSAAAHDIARLHGKPESRESIMHRGKALALVNKCLSKSGQMPGDDTLSAVALFTGIELLFGSPLDFNTHLDGLTLMIKIRGGLDSFKISNPTLFGIINWFDYSGSCNLVAIRRFVPPTQEFHSLSSNPTNAPQSIIQNLPIGYDLRKYIVDLFSALKTVASVLCSDSPDEGQQAESAATISRIDSDLCQSICAPDQEGNPSRRSFVQQSYLILVLLSTALLSKSKASRAGSPQIAGYLDVLEIVISTESDRWGTKTVDLLRAVSGIYSSRMEFDFRVKEVIDASIVLCWYEWRNIKKALLAFFVDDEACEGRLQSLWRSRIATVSAQVT